MTAIVWDIAGKVGAPLAIVLALALGVQTCRLASAQRDEAVARADAGIAKANLAGAAAALEVERISVKAATDAATACSADSADADRRCSSALAGVNADLARARGQLKACVSPEAVADRMGALFPVTP